MEVDLEKSANKLGIPPFDLTITFNGRKYKVREPGGTELQDLLAMGKTDPVKRWTELSAMIGSLTGMKPAELKKMTLQQGFAFMAALVEAVGKRAKLMPRIAHAIADATQPVSTPVN